MLYNVLIDQNHPKYMPVVKAIEVYPELVNKEDVKNLGDLDEAVKKMNDFFNCNQPDFGVKVHHNLIDWEKDSQLICAAVNMVAQTEVRSEPYLHWFTFCGYLSSTSQETTWSVVVSLRHKKATGKKLEKHEREFIRDNPQWFMTESDIEAEQDFNEWMEANGIIRK